MASKCLMVAFHPCPTAPSQDDESDAILPSTGLEHHRQCTQQKPKHPNPFTARRAKDGSTPQSQGRCCCPRHPGRSMPWAVTAQRLHLCTAFICWALQWAVDDRGRQSKPFKSLARWTPRMKCDQTMLPDHQPFRGPCRTRSFCNARRCFSTRGKAR